MSTRKKKNGKLELVENFFSAAHSGSISKIISCIEVFLSFLQSALHSLTLSFRQGLISILRTLMAAQLFT
jgi:tetrahydromethanopterin S-methyltransferase subunit E